MRDPKVTVDLLGVETARRSYEGLKGETALCPGQFCLYATLEASAIPGSYQPPECCCDTMGSALSGPRPRLKRHLSAKERSQLPYFANVVTFDALGTLYRFKEPFADQYLKVARRCGMKLSATPDAVDKAFKVAYKDLNERYPNYGKGKLANPQEWWGTLIEQTFDQATNGATIPQALSLELYNHFSSGAAYELFPEVKDMFVRARGFRKSPFNFGLESTTETTEQYFLSGPTRRITGVVTNSDPRVVDVLKDLGLKIGVVEPQRVQEGTSLPGWFGQTQAVASDWNPDNDIDFVCTSYEAGSEKPDKGIYDYALILADAAGRGLDEQCKQYLSAQSLDEEDLFLMAERIAQGRRAIDWVHAGDDFEKDFRGAQDWGATAFYVKRKGRPTPEEKSATKEGQFLLLDLSDIVPRS